MEDYLALAKNIYTKEQMLRLEREVFRRLGYRLWGQTLDGFLDEYTAMWDDFLSKANYSGEKSRLYFRLPYKE